MFLIENKLKEMHATFITPKNSFLKSSFLEDQKDFDEIIGDLKRKKEFEEVRQMEKIADNNYQNYLWLSEIYLKEEIAIRNLIFELKVIVSKIENYLLDATQYAILESDYLILAKEYSFALLYFSTFLKKERRLVSKSIIVNEFFKERNCLVPVITTKTLEYQDEEQVLVHALENGFSYQNYLNMLKEFKENKESLKKIRQNICKNSKL